MEELELLRRATYELKHLREQNQAIGQRLEVYDNMMALFNADPRSGNRGGMMAPDVVFEMEKRINELDTIKNQKDDKEKL